MFVLLKDVYIWGAPQGGPIGGEGCRHRPSEAQGECLAPAGAFQTETTILYSTCWCAFGKVGWAEALIAEASLLAESRMRHDLKDPRGAETINIDMNKYQALVRINGHQVKTAVFADSQIHARLILQYQFGMNSLASAPSLSEDDDALAVEEAIKMIKPIKPLNLKQARVASLKRNVDSAKQQLKLEKDRQHHQQAIKPISSKP